MARADLLAKPMMHQIPARFQKNQRCELGPATPALAAPHEPQVKQGCLLYCGPVRLETGFQRRADSRVKTYRDRQRLHLFSILRCHLVLTKMGAHRKAITSGLYPENHLRECGRPAIHSIPSQKNVKCINAVLLQKVCQSKNVQSAALDKTLFFNHTVFGFRF